MSKLVSVYVFEGQGYYGKPGVVFVPAKVSEDLAPYRKAESKDWAKIERWLLSKGYRCLTKIGRKHDGAQQRQWWGLVSVFGDVCNDENGNPIPMQLDEIKRVFESRKQQPMPSAEDVWGSDPVRFERRVDRFSIYWVLDRKVDPSEWMLQQGYAPQGYGPGKGKEVGPGLMLAGKPLPDWACFVVSHSNNCD